MLENISALQIAIGTASFTIPRLITTFYHSLENAVVEVPGSGTNGGEPRIVCLPPDPEVNRQIDEKWSLSWAAIGVAAALATLGAEALGLDNVAKLISPVAVGMIGAAAWDATDALFPGIVSRTLLLPPRIVLGMISRLQAPKK